MYSPTTRLLTVLELLQARPGLSGSELADRLEVDRRSVRRYIVMLQDLGIPIESTRGPGGGYRLRPGYKLPPLLFTNEEAVALTLGLRALPRLGIAAPSEAAAGALAKLERVLPESTREQLQALQRAITLDRPSTPEGDSGMLTRLAGAAERHCTVRIRYRDANGQSTERAFDPYGVVNREMAWYSAGFCHLRQDLRTFRLDRILSVKETPDRFAPPPAFDLAGFVSQSLAGYPALWSIEVGLDMPFEEAERRILPSHGTFEAAGNGVVVHARHDDLDAVAHWIAGLGCGFQIIQPQELNDALRRWGNMLVAYTGAFETPGLPG